MHTQDNQQNTEIEKIREQFNYGPYPRVALEDSPKERYEGLYFHNLITAYYLRYGRVPETKGTMILDAGCGSGYSSLVLAEANPGAKIIGIDLSEKSVELAQQRLTYHGFDAEFYAIPLEEIGNLGLEFDYINCDEVLYLLPDPVAGLQAMRSVLKPQGLIRTNLHSSYQRAPYYRSQALFKLMGLMDDSPKEFEEEAVIETMNALRNTARLRVETWNGKFTPETPPEKVKEVLAMNHLFVGDRGFTIPELFGLLEEADLEFISMTNWRGWNVVDLFEDGDNLPALWSMGLAAASIADQLHIYELINPIHRLLDFYCGHPGEPAVSIDEWDDADWPTAIVHLHPQLRTEAMKQDLIRCIQQAQPFEISRNVPKPAMGKALLDPTRAACLLPLWEGKQTVAAIAQRYRQIRPIDPVTLEPVSEEQAFEIVKDLLNFLIQFLYILLERAA
ncbi:MAG: class I SAM-dependent methyltransferase [Oscillatoriophycideae cyanobacterium NC_groundwater_1537_Pr4_S-0.65um_50_18]|nr:class I SAM-dependent methyltransferase [Oscillatoriophycideae cyanobacterium NC_groundwater_1537_Pr4_S-0.65um_50_18]